MTVRSALRGQWPILSVAAMFVLAFAFVAAGYWRRGALLIGIGVGVAAVLRLMLSEQGAGLLVVRGKSIDVAMTASVAVSVIFTALTIDPLGTS